MQLPYHVEGSVAIQSVISVYSMPVIVTGSVAKNRVQRCNCLGDSLDQVGFIRLGCEMC